MRLAVFAYHDVGHACLQELLRTGDEIVGVVTHADNPNEEIWFRSVAVLARQHGLPVHEPRTVNTPEWIARVAAWRPDFLFSFYYRNILAPEILALASRGALNLHGSLLPRYRGRAPVNWVLVHGETETGVTLHYMEAKPDRGDIVAQRRVPITDDDTARTLFGKLTEAAALLMRDTYPLLRSGTAPRVPQDHGQATYFGGRTPEDGRIDWTQGARQIFNLVRAVTHPYPGAFTAWKGRRLLIWQARVQAAAPAAAPPGTIRRAGRIVEAVCGNGGLEVQRMQLEGETEMDAEEWMERHRVDSMVCR